MGRLADLGPSYRCTCQSGYTDLEWVLARQLGSLLLCLSSQAPLVFALKKDVDYLLIAKPVAFNHLGIRLDCALLSSDTGCW